MDQVPTESLLSASVSPEGVRAVNNSHASPTSAAPAGDLLLLERLEHEGADIAVISLNRPAQRNPIDKDTIAALSQLLDALNTPALPDAIVLTGNGATFSAGGDLKGYQSLYRDTARFRRFMHDFDDVCGKLSSSPALTVAMVNGTCVAGGLELALACDLITMSDDARIGDGHLRFAQLPGAGGSQRLVRAIGVQQAKKWLLTGKLFDAATAEAAGLTALVTPSDQLRDSTFDLVAETASLTPLGRANMKKLISIAQVTPLDEGLRLEMDLVHEYATTSYDAVEGLNAFADRRPAVYRGTVMRSADVMDEDQRILDDMARYLRATWDADDLDVEQLRPFGDGNSGDTFTVDIAGGGRTGRFVLRLSPPGVAIRGPADVGRQGRIMAALHRAGAPVPEVLASDSKAVVAGRSFALLEVVDGVGWDAHAERFGHHRVAADSVAALKTIQQVPATATGIAEENPFSPIEEVERWMPLLQRSPESIRNRGEALRMALLDSAAQRCAPTEPVLVHGDLHYGNLLFGPRGVLAVLDWEIASLGHPMTDLGCLAVASLRRRYSPDPNPTGSVEIMLAELVDLYGAEAEPASWHIASSCFKYAAIIGFNLQLHRRGKRSLPVYESLQSTMNELITDGLRLVDDGLADL